MTSDLIGEDKLEDFEKRIKELEEKVKSPN
jgi:hypothetical protein